MIKGTPARAAKRETQKRSGPGSGERGLALSSRPWPERLKALLRFAVLAPSGHNTQPWRVRIDENVMELLPDRRRSTPVVDPDDRELAMSCGAFLFHLRTAAAHFGWQPVVQLLPHAEPVIERDLALRRADVFARIVFHERDGATAPDVECLFDAIPSRRTCRSPFAPVRPSDAAISALVAAAAAEGVRLLVFADEPGRMSVATLVALADREQWANPAFRDELAAWCHAGRDGQRDGLPSDAFGEGGLAGLVAPLAIRSFDLGSSRAARDEELAYGSPLLAVLATGADSELDWLQAGQALDRVMLTAVAEGLATSFLNQSIEVPLTRARVADLLPGPRLVPQLVLRIGQPVGALPPPTPRRPVEEIVVPQAASTATHVEPGRSP